ncbi:MAG: GNAT family N-acetyltransferase [Lachnospiraceae bacterium]|nr:GNAT family N-acetyltransferase [Lachnospiraceae bacterium]
MTINAPLVTQVPALRNLWKEAFGDSDTFLDIFFKTAFSPERCRCIFDDQTAVAALYWFDCTCEGKPVAYIYAVSTAKSHRGQGLCLKLMTETHQHLTSLGYEGCLLVPGNAKLFEMYAKMGYKTSSNIREFQCKASLEELSVCPISAFEYARLRKLLLPNGSVLQENENLRFLQTQVQFYMGLGFLLAAYGEEDKLHGIELLGDVTAAPAITHSLGYKHGTFRTIGNGRPFAMYHSLNNSLTAPKYFGFAFD